MATGDIIISNNTITPEILATIASEVVDLISTTSKDPGEYEEVTSLTGVSSLPVFQISNNVYRLVRVAMSVLQGTDGREVELQVTDEYIQWRYAGDYWKNLIAIVNLKGDPGETPVFRTSSVGIEWKYESESDESYRELIAIDDLKLNFSDLTDEQKEELKLHFSDLSDEDLDLLKQPATEAAAEVRSDMDKIKEEAESVNQTLTDEIEAIKQEANTLIGETNAAKEAAEVATANAISVSDHPGYIGEDYHVYTWDYTIDSYVKTDTILRPEGFSIYRSYSSIDEMNADLGNVPEGKFVLINTDDVEQEDNAKLYVRGTTAFEYLVDMSGAIGFTGKTPQFSIGTVMDGENVGVSISSDGYDDSANPKYKLNFVIKRGAQGFAPIIEAGEISTLEPGEDVSATLQFKENNEDGIPVYTLNISIPKGDKGNIGDTGKTPILSQVEAESGELPSGNFVEDGVDDKGNPRYKLSLILPKGENGLPPVFEKGTITTVDANTNADVEVVENGYTESGNPIFVLNFSIPKGKDGEGKGNVSVIDNTGLVSGVKYLFVPDSTGSTEGKFVEYIEPDIPKKVSELSNDSNFIDNSVSNLLNYYLKSETYSRQEVLDLIGDITTVTFQVVDVRPTTGEGNIIYLVPSDSSEDENVKDEYIYIDGSWELIGTTKIDLTGYLTKTEADAKYWHSGNDGSGSGLDADMLDGINSTNFQKLWLTVIDTTSLDEDTWYPVVLYGDTWTDSGTEHRLWIQGKSTVTGSWNTRPDKTMAYNVSATLIPSGWGFVPKDIGVQIHTAALGAGCDNAIGTIGQIFQISVFYVYVRGGAKYNFYTEYNDKPVLFPEGYSRVNRDVTYEVPIVTEYPELQKSGTSVHSQYATMLHTARNIWGQSFRGTDDVDGTLTINTDSNKALSINSTNTESWNTVFSALYPNIGTYNTVALSFGKSSSEYDGGQIIYYHANDGSASNSIRIGLQKHNSLLNVFGNGNVGIGTVDPQAKLHVSGGIQADDKLIINYEKATGSDGVLNINKTNSPSSYDRPISILYPNLAEGGTPNIYVGKNNAKYNGGYLSYTHTADDSSSNYMSIGLYSADKILNVLGNGNVGIGTTSPTNKLEVNGSITIPENYCFWYKDSNGTAYREILLNGNKEFFVGLDNASTGIKTYVVGNSIGFECGTNRILYHVMDSNGNVGINNTSPSTTLDVNGSIKGESLYLTDRYIYGLSDGGDYNRFNIVSDNTGGGLYIQAGFYDGHAAEGVMRLTGINNAILNTLILRATNVDCTTGTIDAKSFSGNGSSITALNASNISSGTLAKERLATSGVTAGSYGPTAAVTGNNGTTINIPQITVDEYGRVTSVVNRVFTAVNTDTNTTYSAATTSANGLMSSTDKAKMDRIRSYTTATTVASLNVNYETIYVTLTANASLSASATGTAYNGYSITAYVYTASAVTITIPTTGNYESMCGSSFTTVAGGWVEFNLTCLGGIWHIAKLEQE